MTKITKKNQAIVAFTFLIFISLSSATVQAATYTFDHDDCSAEDPLVCLCDDYDAVTDTCTVSTQHSVHTHRFGDPHHPASNCEITFSKLIITESGQLDATRININADEVIVEGAIISHLATTPPDVTINSREFKLSGTLENLHGNLLINLSGDGDISGYLVYGNTNFYAAKGPSNLVIIAKNLNISGTIKRSQLRGYNIDITCENDLSISGAFTTSSGQYDRYDYAPLSINAKNFYLKYPGKINANFKIVTILTKKMDISGQIYGSGTFTIDTNELNLESSSKIKSYDSLFINYCRITPENCRSAITCPNIDCTDDNVITQSCTNPGAPTCSIGDGCTAIDPVTLESCPSPDPDCPQSQPIPTLISLHGTVTDIDDKPINGTVTITSLEKCADTTCATKTPVDTTGVVNDISFTDGIVNSMLGPYNIIPDLTYMLTVKVCNLLGLCDEDIQIRFTD